MIESYGQFFKICEGIKDRRTVVDVWKNGKLECLGRIGRAGLGWFEVETGNGTVAVDFQRSEIKSVSKHGWRFGNAGEWSVMERPYLIGAFC